MTFALQVDRKTGWFQSKPLFCLKKSHVLLLACLLVFLLTFCCFISPLAPVCVYRNCYIREVFLLCFTIGYFQGVFFKILLMKCAEGVARSTVYSKKKVTDTTQRHQCTLALSQKYFRNFTLFIYNLAPKGTSELLLYSFEDLNGLIDAQLMCMKLAI